MKNRVLVLLVGMVCFLIQCAPRPVVVTGAGAWVYLGDKWVNFGVDHDELLFGNLADNYRKIKLRVTNGPLHVMDMKVHYDNGGIQDIPLRSIIRKGQESRVIDLNGASRNLQKITFWYETIGYARGRSRVAVWGLK